MPAATRRALARLTPLPAAPLLLLLLLLASCAAPETTHTVRGILVDLRGTSLERFESLTLRTEDGRDLVLTPAEDYQPGGAHPMSPGHLRQHMALAEPVIVTYRERGGRLLVVRISD